MPETEPAIPGSFTSFSELALIPRLCDQLFVRHQISLMRSERDGAYDAFHQMYRLRSALIAAEEDLLLPAYGKFVTDPQPGAALRYFKREHKLILRQLNAFMKRLMNLALQEADILPRRVSLFEEYHDFKDLLDHHDARDRVFLYPALDRVISRQDKLHMLAKLKKTYLPGEM